MVEERLSNFPFQETWATELFFSGFLLFIAFFRSSQGRRKTRPWHTALRWVGIPFDDLITVDDNNYREGAKTHSRVLPSFCFLFRVKALSSTISSFIILTGKRIHIFLEYRYVWQLSYIVQNTAHFCRSESCSKLVSICQNIICIFLWRCLRCNLKIAVLPLVSELNDRD